jgi:hypothetical protein
LEVTAILAKLVAELEKAEWNGRKPERSRAFLPKAGAAARASFFPVWDVYTTFFAFMNLDLVRLQA